MRKLLLLKYGFQILVAAPLAWFFWLDIIIFLNLICFDLVFFTQSLGIIEVVNHFRRCS